ncbi:P1 family peptidase [Chitinophaga sp. NPDC101104]|uniref:DmpA family aminopeptidase n=1 Tax=Chitinophaga sp. NPDC101104 TaxID=3390561 RepID=UPI003D01BB2E
MKLLSLLMGACILGSLIPDTTFAQQAVRARDLGIPLTGKTGKFNAITDVPGVKVGLTTLISGEGNLQTGKGPVRTGVTAILPRGNTYDPVFAGWYALNGNGEMTGTTWITESGFLEGPVTITNTHSVGIVRDAVVEWQYKHKHFLPLEETDGLFWALPIVAETYDGMLNDINGMHVTKEHVFHALDSATSGPVSEGSTGGGTGMVSHGFKAGTGTSSRVVRVGDSAYTVGVLVQANHGAFRHLTIAGVPMWPELKTKEWRMKFGEAKPGTGSIIVIVATDAPLLPHQLNRIARRVALGVARVGGMGENSSGDIFLAFSTANPRASRRDVAPKLDMLPNDQIDPLFTATVFATEEAILNAIVAGRDMTGINGNFVPGIPHTEIIRLLKKYSRYAGK